VLRRSCNANIMKFGHTLLVKYGDLYFIRLFNDRPIVLSSWGRWNNVDWVELMLDGTFKYLFLCYIFHNFGVAKFGQMLNEVILIVLLIHLVFLQNLCIFQFNICRN
jgi:hypothetical protein